MKTLVKILLSIIPALGVLLHLVFIFSPKQASWYVIAIAIVSAGLFFLSVMKFPTIRRSAYRLIGWASIIFFTVPLSVGIMILGQYPTMSVQQKGFLPLGLIIIGILLLFYSLLPSIILGITALLLRQRKK